MNNKIIMLTKNDFDELLTGVENVLYIVDNSTYYKWGRDQKFKKIFNLVQITYKDENDTILHQAFYMENEKINLFKYEALQSVEEYCDNFDVLNNLPDCRTCIRDCCNDCLLNYKLYHSWKKYENNNNSNNFELVDNIVPSCDSVYFPVVDQLKVTKQCIISLTNNEQTTIKNIHIGYKDKIYIDDVYLFNLVFKPSISYSNKDSEGMINSYISFNVDNLVSSDQTKTFDLPINIYTDEEKNNKLFDYNIIIKVIGSNEASGD